ncbi:benzoate/H(+) symporter BenE family transporter [Humidisolicoccus flavus]|uniref:benzoate/H(+) symporter BenE family transporter n=1 Tax=Humidisolicoccus flavus TaxID=3111414 RepID=UPI003252F06E
MTRDPRQSAGLQPPIVAGIVTALVGFTSSFAVVLQGLRAVGATESQAASGLFAITIGFAILILFVAMRTRLPITFAWSTPGAALLVATGTVEGGWAAAVGAFGITGGLIVLAGAVPAIGRFVARIPASLAQAMLAGVLVQLCVAPIAALATIPLLVLPVIAVWLVIARFFARWAVPAALVAALIVIAVVLTAEGTPVPLAAAIPTLEFTVPTLTWQAAIGIALPLFIVTMASQNIAGVAVLSSLNVTVPWRLSIVGSGIGTMLTSIFGGHAMNLAAISAALAAGEEAGERSKRWIAAITAGIAYLVLGLCSGLLVAVLSVAPEGLIETVAGLALLSTFASALVAAVSDPRHRISAAVTFLVAASGLSIIGISGAFWALVAGLLVRAVLERGSGTPRTEAVVPLDPEDPAAPSTSR